MLFVLEWIHVDAVPGCFTTFHIESPFNFDFKERVSFICIIVSSQALDLALDLALGLALDLALTLDLALDLELALALD